MKKNKKDFILKIQFFFIYFIIFSSFTIIIYNYFLKKQNSIFNLKNLTTFEIKLNFDFYIQNELNKKLKYIKYELFEYKIKALPVIINDKIEISFKYEKDFQLFNDFFRENNSEIFNINKNDIKVILSFKPQYIKSLRKQLLKITFFKINNRFKKSNFKNIFLKINGKEENIQINILNNQNKIKIKNLIEKNGQISFHFMQEDPKKIENDKDNIIKVRELTTNTEIPLIKKPVLNGDLIEKVYLDRQNTQNIANPILLFKFNKYGTKKLEEITKNNIGKILIIIFNSELINLTMINNKITNGTIQIFNNLTMKDAVDIISLANFGSYETNIEINEIINTNSFINNKILASLFIIFVLLFTTICIFYKQYLIYIFMTNIINFSIFFSILCLLNIFLTNITNILIFSNILLGTIFNIIIFFKIKNEKNKSILENDLIYNINKSFNFMANIFYSIILIFILIILCFYTKVSINIQYLLKMFMICMFSLYFSNILFLKTFLINFYKKLHY